MKKFFTYIYQLLVFASVIGGAFSLYTYFTEKSDYELVFTIDEQNHIIENNTGLDDLKIIYKDIEVKSLYGTKITLTNTGNKAIAKDLIFDPIIICLQPTNILVNVKTKLDILRSKNSFTLNIELLNPGEQIDFYLLTTKKAAFSLKYKIREIPKIKVWNKIENPPIEKKFFDINWFWFVFIITSLFLTLDAMFLLKEDQKLERLLSFIRNITNDVSFEKTKTIEKLSQLYGEYSDSLPFVFVDKNYLIKIISEKIDSLDTRTEKDRYILYKFVIDHVQHANMYYLRGTNIFVGPMMFFVALIGIVWNLVF